MNRAAPFSTALDILRAAAQAETGATVADLVVELARRTGCPKRQAGSRISEVSRRLWAGGLIECHGLYGNLTEYEGPKRFQAIRITITPRGRARLASEMRGTAPRSLSA